MQLLQAGTHRLVLLEYDLEAVASVAHQTDFQVEIQETPRALILDIWTEKRKVPVKRIGGRDARKLNEIEWFRGKILANVWYEDVLLVIDPVTGAVEKEYGTSNPYDLVLYKSLQFTNVYCLPFSLKISALFSQGKKESR